MATRAFSGRSQPVEKIIAYIDGVVRQGRWAVVVFHGIGAEWNTVDLADFNRVLQYASENRKRIWIAPFVQVADYVRAHRSPLHRE